MYTSISHISSSDGKGYVSEDMETAHRIQSQKVLVSVGKDFVEIWAESPSVWK
jgi:hypothetical protein